MSGETLNSKSPSSKSQEECGEECQELLKESEPTRKVQTSESQSREEESQQTSTLKYQISESQSAASCRESEEKPSASASRIKTASKQPQIEKQTIKILITGKSGNSKSVIINGLAGKDLIPERKGVVRKPRSEKLEYYSCTRGNVNFEVWSSPHLQDEDKRINRDDYLKTLKESCSDVHLIIYCVNMTETRFLPGNPDIKAMIELTKLFGESCWNKAVFALTYANVAAMEAFAPDDDEDNSQESRSQAFKEGISAWKAIIYNVLTKEAKVREDLEVRAVPAGHYRRPSLPDRHSWLSSMFMECGTVMPNEVQEALVEFNTHRFKDSRSFTAADVQGKKSYEQQIYVAFGTVKKSCSSLIHLIKRKRK